VRGNLIRKSEIAELVPSEARNLAPGCFGFASQLYSQRQSSSLERGKNMPRSLRIGTDGRGIYKTIDGITRYSLNLIRNPSAIDNMQ
jgi:hypothetical protein